MSYPATFVLPDWPRAHGIPPVTGVMREHTGDFIVEEIPRTLPSGEGQHVWLFIEKRQLNTDQVARQLARIAKVPRKQVSFAGMKDRQALTRQWFSVDLAGQPEPDWQSLDSEQITVCEYSRHGRKLRRGHLQGNRFSITLRQLQGDMEALPGHLQEITEKGVPNYFGVQRFGHQGSNLNQAQALIQGERLKLSRHERGIIYSAARSYLFNMVLAERVRQGTWDRVEEGDLMGLADRRGFFTADADDATLPARLAAMEIHPTGPLWGRGDLGPASGARDVEQIALQPYAAWQQWLLQQGLEMDRRPLRLAVSDLQWQRDDDVLQLTFALSAGGFATSVLRECVRC